jgi:integrase
MVDVNDPSRIQQKLDRRWTQLENSNIDDRDRGAIRAFVEDRRNREAVSRTTRTSDLSGLRCASERATVPLVDMNHGDLRELFRTLARPRDQGGYGLDPDGSGMFNYKRALTLFFEFLDTEPNYQDYPFHDAITLPDMDTEGASMRELMLTAGEVESLKDAAANPRDRALIALFADIGGRITLILSLRVGDMHLDGDEPYFTPNEGLPDGLKKFDSGRVPILYSRAELRTYHRHHHPEPDTAEAPFWPIQRDYDPDRRSDCAVGASSIRDRLRDSAERAGIDKPVEPHHFRRTATTRMSNSDRLNPQEIVQITGWTSSDMLEAYDYTAEDERASQIHAALGFSDGPDPEDGGDSLVPTVCGNCREQLASSYAFCPTCGEPVGEAARAEVAETVGAVKAEQTEVGDAGKAFVYQQIAEKIGATPDVVREVLDHDPPSSSS